MKLKYFRKHEWVGEWIEEAESLVREEYAARYEVAADDETNVTPKKKPRSKNSSGFASFGDLSVATTPRVSEILEYLKHPVEKVNDPLRWWVDNQHTYPNLHRMALDYLSIPGMCSI
jgi:hypothetical protein